jgi:hypothetical protein
MARTHYNRGVIDIVSISNTKDIENRILTNISSEKYVGELPVSLTVSASRSRNSRRLAEIVQLRMESAYLNTMVLSEQKNRTVR